MTTRHRLGDRREYLRFDVAGQLWASLDFGEPVIVRNIAEGGVLIEATLPSAAKPIRAAHIALRDRGPDLTVVVRHVSPAPEDTGPDRYLVGLEFIDASPSQTVDIGRLVRDWQNRAE